MGQAYEEPAAGQVVCSCGAYHVDAGGAAFRCTPEDGWAQENALPVGFEETHTATRCRVLTDTAAVEAIHRALDGLEWSPDTLDQVAAALAWSGRPVREPGEQA